MSLTLCLAYLIGSTPFAFLMARRRGSDLRRIGSGNLGAANVARASGMPAGVLVALLDIGKGAAGVLLAERLHPDGPSVPAAAGLAVIIGHVYPVWLRFRGGKGVATACGAFSVLAPLAAVPAMAIFLLSAALTRHVSVGSLLASLALSPAAYVTGSPAPVVGAAAAASALVVFRHRSNLVRLREGTEPRLGVGAVTPGVADGRSREA